ncbi:hypothetical protein RND81_14G093800 [Saponaria officinalis]|uniref:Uncharacterized protein n=1 Tax=Saponaria officinalis TaxID=3572 RepID=A0AAW1GQ85_SAPOF
MPRLCHIYYFLIEGKNHILTQYCEASGQRINYEKSSIIFSPSTTLSRVFECTLCTGAAETSLPILNLKEEACIHVWVINWINYLAKRNETRLQFLEERKWNLKAEKTFKTRMRTEERMDDEDRDQVSTVRNGEEISP